MAHIFVYGDSMSWGIVPGSRRRLPFESRWPGVLENELQRGGRNTRVTEDCLNGRRTVWEDPFKAGRNGRHGIEQRIEAQSPLDLVILLLGINDFQATHQNLAWHSGMHSARPAGLLDRKTERFPLLRDHPACLDRSISTVIVRPPQGLSLGQ